MKKLSLILAILMMVSLLSANIYGENLENSVEVSLADAVKFNGNYYICVTEKLTWHEAKAYCERLGGHLATITSKEENDFCSQLWKDLGYDKCWLGATDEVREGTWVWVTGEEWSYSNWEDNEPNNNDTNDVPEHCLAYEKSYGSKWNDLKASNENVFICEWEKDSMTYSDIAVPGKIDVYDLNNVIAVNVSWEFPVFTYSVESVWDQASSAYVVVEGSGKWSDIPAEITVVNRSNQNISTKYSFATTVENSGIDGIFTTDEAGETLLVDNTVTLDSAAKNYVATSETVYFFITEGALTETHADEGVIGNVTIAISALGRS